MNLQNFAWTLAWRSFPWALAFPLRKKKEKVNTERLRLQGGGECVEVEEGIEGINGDEKNKIKNKSILK